jgi:hypothetical protein
MANEDAANEDAVNEDAVNEDAAKEGIQAANGTNSKDNPVFEMNEM